MSRSTHEPLNVELLGEQKVQHLPRSSTHWLTRADVCPSRTPRPLPYLTHLSAFPSELPYFAFWRNNLCAASQTHNLLFLALRSQIHAYVPTYPFQTLPSTPTHILSSHPLDSTPGYIDPSNPHDINTLTISTLGTEEVLISAHDNGNVVLWYTSDLTRPALQVTVGKSAWGVSIHPQTRRLAVSSNAHEITVFELAPGGAEKKVLRGHKGNIPSVSFLEDSSGRWLAGTSIEGEVILWDVDEGVMVEGCRMGLNERGWSVLFLKPQAFRKCPSFTAAMGEATACANTGARVLETSYYELPAAVRVTTDTCWDITPRWARAGAWVEAPDSDDDDELSDDDDNYQLSLEPAMSPSPARTLTSPPPPALPIFHESESEDDADDASPPPPLTTPSPAPAPTPPPQESTQPHPPPPHSHLLLTTQSSLYLLPSAHLTPTTLCRSPLPRPALHLRGLDRLNMTLQIPELSLVLVASQKGVMGLWRLGRCGDVWGMRFEGVLEGRGGGEVPFLGVAAGRVQGGRGVGEGRWRVWGVGMDGGVRCWEVGRGCGEVVLV